MEKLLQYYPNSYFNDTDYFLLYNDGLKKYNVTKLQFYNGNWYSIGGLEYKMTSIPCVSMDDIKGFAVLYKGTQVKGNISKHHYISDSIGIHWESGKNIKKYGLPYFWNDPKNLEPIYVSYE